ncbi:5916_t:CDS:2 [Entrophospora sp. SA101]|nr:5916_t:CDS:2 [Entrophospora sp. SA101]CAJ0827802.1 6646_t:CDS:2 [Entrophospora sp. SA101]
MSIFILPVRLHIVSIPKNIFRYSTHAILRYIIYPERDQTLFSLTENDLEVSIITSAESIERDFIRLKQDYPSIEITDDAFRALILENEESLDDSGKRINDLSALLSHVKISIFYLSTYQEDFLSSGPSSHPSSPIFFTPNFVDKFPTMVMKNEEEILNKVGTQCEKKVTGNRLRLVGLNRLIIFYTDLLNNNATKTCGDDGNDPPNRFLSYTATLEGISLVIDESMLNEFPEYLLNMSNIPIPLKCIQLDLSKFGLVHSKQAMYW